MNVGTGGAIIQDELLQVLREAVRDAGPPHWSEMDHEHAKCVGT